MSDEQHLAGAIHALDRGNGARALEHLADVQSPSADSWSLNAQALRLVGRGKEAEEAIRQGLLIDPLHIQLRLDLANTLSETSPQQAEALHLAVLNDYPTNDHALVSYTWLLATNNDAAGAAKVIDRVSGVTRASDPFALSTQGVIALGNGDAKTAREFLDRGLAANPNNVFVHYLQAALAEITPGDTKRVADHLGLAAASDPRSAAALGYEARFLNHPVMLPTRIVDRIGAGKLWLAWIALIFGFRRVWPDGPLGWVVLVYLIFAVYTWVAPPLLRKWLEWKGEL